MSDHEAPMHLCCLLRARPGMERELSAYEDKVLALVPDHGGELLSRVVGDGAEGHPHEVHVYRFDGRAALESYMADPRRLELAEERDRAIASTELFPVAIRGLTACLPPVPRYIPMVANPNRDRSLPCRSARSPSTAPP